MHNTFTYRHSDLPSLRPEIKAEIVALDVQIANLIIKSQGNYRELEELREVLDNCLDSCELNLNSIRIVADESPQALYVSTMKNLPMTEKQIIFYTAIMSSISIETLASICNKTVQEITSELCEKTKDFGESITTDKTDTVLDDLIEIWNAKPD